jgi:hypothetical protein
MSIDDPRDPDEEALDEIENESEDAGLDDDEGGGEAGGQESEDDEGQEGQVEERRPSRASKAIVEAKRIAREAAAEAAALKKELAELRQRQQAPQTESREQEEAKLALMSVEERVDYKLAKAEKENQRQMAVVQFQASDQADKAAYDAKSSYEPRFKKYAADVEKLLLAERQAGRNFPRETILKFVLGERVMNAKPAVDKQRRDAQRRIGAQRTSSEAGRSDRAAPRGRSNGNALSDLERRLAGVYI